jgi:multiple sugar transport system ATP-binding protein
MANLRFDDLTKTFQDGAETVLAVNELNMAIDDGDFLVIVGPSGCGKTTTLRMVAGLETITDGEIYLDDTPMSGKKPQDRNIAMVFQSYALYPHMTVRENMRFGLEQSTDLPDDEIEESVENIGDLLDIPELLDRKPGDLSGGQQQRVALGRAIIRDPEVFLLDEPLSNLDAKLRAEMRTELQRLQAELDTTTIYVTHDQTEAMTMGDRIAILDGGELQQIGTPLECYYEPENQFVAGFIGEPSMNFVDCRRDGDVLHTDSFDYRLSEETLAAVESTTDLTMGIRPEDIEVVTEATEPNDVPVEVDVVEPFGKENNLYLVPEDRETDETIIAIVEGRTRVGAGDRAAMRISEEHVHLFDGESGVALRNAIVDEADLSPVVERSADT